MILQKEMQKSFFFFAKQLLFFGTHYKDNFVADHLASK